MPLKIGTVTLKDLNVLQKIEKECFSEEAFTKEQMTYLIETPTAISLKAEEENKIVGFIIGLIETLDKVKVGHIYTIDVTPENRRTGIGLQLLDKLELNFLEAGVEMAYLEVRADNKAAFELYCKKGYVDPQPLENYYLRGALGFRMRKQFKK